MSSEETISIVGSEVMPLDYGSMNSESSPSPSSSEKTVEGVRGDEVVGVGGNEVVEVAGGRLFRDQEFERYSGARTSTIPAVQLIIRNQSETWHLGLVLDLAPRTCPYKSRDKNEKGKESIGIGVDVGAGEQRKEQKWQRDGG
ncbi:hypothetical protein SLEP1_g29086 [Rubroshorea leprosula]|uniref:Uncharacterized protein n=1 Tax=Rubroshorea leprosula TaxID=152421 RepID=A0AAV5JYB1_9ROSI|nr:hypothetical protein SLEP1_g29086 [Rubroshorea leprosula]